MEFVGANTYASMRDYLYMIGALDLVSEPSGAISRVSGKAGQIGGIGSAFEVPMDVTGARSAGGVPLKGVTGTEQRVNFSRELVGDAAFDGMVTFLKNVMEERDENPQYELTERGEFYVAPTPKDFLGRFGISVMGSFSGGEARDVGGILQLGGGVNRDAVVRACRSRIYNAPPVWRARRLRHVIVPVRASGGLWTPLTPPRRFPCSVARRLSL